MRFQLLANNITEIDYVFFTHSHADHIFGINELRTFWIKNKKKEQRIERKAKQREQELRTFRKKQNNLKKEKVRIFIWMDLESKNGRLE